MRKIAPLAVIALFAGVMIYLVSGMGALRGTAEPPEPILLPESWNGFTRTFQVTANEAVMEFTRQHIKQIPIVDGARAGYEKAGARFELWVASGRSEAHAAQMVQDMTAKIGKAHEVFKQPQPVELGGAQLYRTEGQEKVNFYYAKGRRVYWIGVTGSDPEGLVRQIHSEL